MPEPERTLIGEHTIDCDSGSPLARGYGSIGGCELSDHSQGVEASVPFCIKVSSCPSLKHLPVWTELRYTGLVGATRRFYPYSSCCP